MIRLISLLFWLVVLAVLVTVGLANRDLVTLHAMPASLAAIAGISPDVQMPLFLVIFLSVAVGLLIGFVWEWLREGPLRAQAQGHARSADALAREVGRMRAEKADRGEDILALLDAPKRR